MSGNNVAEDFGRRMRERMPSHNVWHRSTAAPTLSRPANDALWDDLRSRLRSYHDQRQDAIGRATPRVRFAAIKGSAGATTAIVAAFILLLLAFAALLH